MRIYMIRHGETELNQRGCYYGKTDAALTEKGRRQAEELGRYFREMTWDRIVVSPLKRAWDTAILATGRDPENFEAEERLGEQSFGIFEGLTYPEICQRYPKEMEAWNRDFSDYRIPEGESFSDVRRRVEAWVKSLPTDKGNMLVVAHKGTLGHMLAAMLDMPLQGYWNFVFDQGCYSCVDLEDGYAIIRRLNQTVSLAER